MSTEFTLKELRRRKPTKTWLDDLEPEYNKYQNPLIAKTNYILDEFIQNLESYEMELTRKNAKSEVKELVEKLNQLHKIQENYIETGEREDLCIFINNCLEASGIKLAKHEDWTIEWRYW